MVEYIDKNSIPKGFDENYTNPIDWYKVYQKRVRGIERAYDYVHKKDFRKKMIVKETRNPIHRYTFTIWVLAIITVFSIYFIKF